MFGKLEKFFEGEVLRVQRIYNLERFSRRGFNDFRRGRARRRFFIECFREVLRRILSSTHFASFAQAARQGV
jgi:hypothetical protein